MSEAQTATPDAPKIYHLDGKEVHLFGDYVGVVWPTRKEVEAKVVSIAGEPFTAERVRTVRCRAPYLDFLWIREEGSDGPWEDEDSPVQGGLSLEQARNVLGELAAAIAYLEKQ